MELAVRALAAQGKAVKLAPEMAPGDLESFDLRVFSQPNLSSVLIEGVNACLQAGKPYAIDLDQDYHHLPADHPAYAGIGPGNPRSLQALEIMLEGAQWVSVASKGQAETYRKFARRVEVAPPAWDAENRLWNRPVTPHSSFQVGWMGTAADRPDLLSIQDELAQWLNQTPQASLVVAGDPFAYETFHELPEARRMYLPSAVVDDIPYLLAQFDVLLVPLRENAFNQARSDRALMEAGVRRLPWIATPVPSYREWAAGGMYAREPGDWAAALTRLAQDAPLRMALGEEGRKKAEARAS
jgi:glycosyltransferase involved in cell wall biosynthesis